MPEFEKVKPEETSTFVWSPHNQRAEVFCSSPTSLSTETGNGIKHDQGKARWDLLPWPALEELVKVYTNGATKYSDWNWARGMKWSRLLAALMRHLCKLVRGEWLDPESGLPHAAHIAWYCFTLLEYHRMNKGLNDLGDKGIQLMESGQPQ